MHPSFVCIAQKVKRAKLIDDENILKRMSFLLAAVIQLSVNFVAWTANGTFYAVMDKKGAHPSRAAVLHATVLHTTVLPSIAAPVRRQCVPAGDCAAKAHN
jgi:hypothetical protein